MSNSNFKKSIFNIVEYFTKHELSDQGKKLIIHYFNQSVAPSTYLRVIEAIERYLQEKVLDQDDFPPQLTTLLNTMSSEADDWDKE